MVFMTKKIKKKESMGQRMMKREEKIRMMKREERVKSLKSRIKKLEMNFQESDSLTERQRIKAEIKKKKRKMRIVPLGRLKDPKKKEKKLFQTGIKNKRKLGESFFGF